MELGTVSILVQLLLILVLAVAFTGRRRMRLRQDRMASAAPPPAPVVRAPLSLPPALPDPDEISRVSEELLLPCFADTCADWAQMLSAQTDRIALDEPVAVSRTVPPAPARSVPGSMSCTIAPQAQHCA